MGTQLGSWGVPVTSGLGPRGHASPQGQVPGTSGVLMVLSSCVLGSGGFCLIFYDALCHTVL